MGACTTSYRSYLRRDHQDRHLLKHRDLLPRLKQTGCLFVTSAVESVDDAVLAKLAEGHTRADFVKVARDFRSTGLTLAPTFIAFTPWTTRESYGELLATLLELNLVEHVAPIQLALRLLIPRGSRMLELDDVQSRITGFDERRCCIVGSMRIRPWIARRTGAEAGRAEGPAPGNFGKMWELVADQPLPETFDLMPRATIPYMDEPWYC